MGEEENNKSERYVKIDPERGIGVSPSEWYKEFARDPDFVFDTAQLKTIQQLDWLYTELLKFKAYREIPFMKTFGRRSPPKGIYIHGGVGRGKSMLMDNFFMNLPYRRKRRTHFHSFMLDIHAQLDELKHEEDPLVKVATKIALQTRVLCFDEFHVNDIADAMILGRLLDKLLEKGVVMVITSNYAPDELFKNGLQRERFLPAIELIKRNLIVVNIDGDTDYRLKAFEKFSVYHTPLKMETELKLEEAFHKVATEILPDKEIFLNDRKIPVKKLANGAIWFTFFDICCGPRSQLDYLKIAKEFHTVVVSQVPQFLPEQANEARRFTTLVDIFYDHKVNLIISAAVQPQDLYTEGLFAEEFQRTVSRLLEMQTRDYLAARHVT